MAAQFPPPSPPDPPARPVTAPNGDPDALDSHRRVNPPASPPALSPPTASPAAPSTASFAAPAAGASAGTHATDAWDEWDEVNGGGHAGGHVGDGGDVGGRSRSKVVVVVAALLAVVALVAVGVVVFVGGDDEAAGSGDRELSLEEAWDVRVSAFRDVDDVDAGRIVSADDEIAIIAVPLSDGGGTVVVAIDLADGAVLWDLETTLEFGGAPPAQRVGDVLVLGESDQSADDDLSTAIGSIRAVDVRTGDALWDVDGLISESSWTIVDDVVLASRADAADGTVQAIDVATGDERWRMGDADGFVRPWATHSNGIVMLAAVGDEFDYVGVGIDGDERWRRPIGEYPAIDPEPPAVDPAAGEVVALPTSTGLLGLDLGTGDERWSVDLALAGADDTALSTDADSGSTLVCSALDDEVEFSVVDTATGEVRWDASVAGENAAVFGFVQGNVLTTDESNVGVRCSFRTTAVSAPRLTSYDAVSGDVVYELDGGDDDEYRGDRLLAWQGNDFDAFALVLDDSDERSIVDAATGETFATVDVADADGPVFLRRYGDTAVGLELAFRDDAIRLHLAGPDGLVADPAPLELGRDMSPIGFAGGLLLIRTGSDLIAID